MSDLIERAERAIKLRLTPPTHELIARIRELEVRIAELERERECVQSKLETSQTAWPKEEPSDPIYLDFLRTKIFQLWDKDMKFAPGSGVYGCCIKRVIDFCLKQCPTDGDVVSCSEKCPDNFRQKMVFDGKSTWRTQPNNP